MSNIWSKPLAALVLAVAWLSPAFGQQAADPARWGVYATLPGMAHQGGNGLRVQWRWQTPGESLLEEYLLPQTGRILLTNAIVPGPQPGTLVLTDSSRGWVWDGTLQPDGSISFVARGGRKMSYRALVGNDGAFEMRRTTVDRGAITSEKPARAAERFTPLGRADERVAQAAEYLAPKPEPVAKVSASNASSPAEPAAPVAAPTRDFGFLGRYLGRLFVSEFQTLEIYREGNGFALQLGEPNGSRTRRWVVSLDPATGDYDLSETAFPTGINKRLAYFDDSGALYLEYNDETYRYMNRISAADESLLFETRIAERKSFGRYGAYNEWVSSRYRPATDESLRLAAIKSEQNRARAQQKAEEARELEREKDQQWLNNMNALNQGLQNALDDATASEQRSRAALDETLQRASEQAAYERNLAAQREQQQANTRRAEDTSRAREATERQYEIARQFEAQQQAQSQARQAESRRANESRSTVTPVSATANGIDAGQVASCPQVYKSGVGASGYANTQAEAERWARRDMELQCPKARYSAGAMQCSQKNQGDVVEIDSKGRSSKVGERLAWICQADYRCSEPSDACAKGPARGAAQ